MAARRLVLNGLTAEVGEGSGEVQEGTGGSPDSLEFYHELELYRQLLALPLTPAAASPRRRARTPDPAPTRNRGASPPRRSRTPGARANHVPRALTPPPAAPAPEHARPAKALAFQRSKMSEEKELIKKRGSYKGRLTTFSTYVNNIEVHELTSVEANELQLRINKMENVYSQYDEVQLRLECLADDINTQLSERDEFESQYYSIISTAQNMLQSYTKNKDELGSERSTRASNHKLVKLPVIQLPKFSGSYEHWLGFHDTFVSLIHSNDDIDDINKFHYLKASLEGTAATVIQSIEFSTQNYGVVWKLLCERFDNKRLLRQNHVSAIFNIEQITKESSFSLKRTIDQLNKNLRSLESLGEPVKHWDTLLIYIVSQKLDSKTHREWEEYKVSLDTNKSITLESFLKFLRDRADLLETLELTHNHVPGRANTSNKSSPKLKTMVSMHEPRNNNVPSQKCPQCNGEHNLSNCSSFLSLSNNSRLELLPSLKVCFNCFRSGHYANHCKRPGCKLCKRKHNTLIHVARPASDGASARGDNNNGTAHAPPEFSPVTPVAPGSSSSSSGNDTGARNNGPVTLSARVSTSIGTGQDVLLSTVLLKVYDNTNCEHIARAVLDSGSTSCLMTENLHKKLNLSIDYVNKSIMGINNATSHVGKMCRVPIKSLTDGFSTSINCFILPSITDDVPCRHIDLMNLDIPSDICLADPNFYQPAPVDLIIGADLFWDVLGSNIIKLGTGQPVLCETRFGWLVSGPINSGHVSSSAIKCCFSSVLSHSQCFNDEIQDKLTQFWQLEEVSHKSFHYSPEELLCENHFKQHTTRLTDGRFCVRLPLKQSSSVLGDSFQRAKHCLFSLERRGKAKPTFKKKYTEFMSEYKALNHMTEITQISEKNSYFIPHHGIERDVSSTTKFRVVFNASSPTTSGISLNNIQMVGATVQDDLLSILLRFRQHKFVLAADVEKMYRQIVVHPDDRHLQQILWRDHDCDPLRTYQLNTVTYGTASAPFLATRCLRQIGFDCDDDTIKEIITHDFYVDDLLTGGDDIAVLKGIRQKVTAALASAGMNLRKWKSNERSLLRELTATTDTTVDLNIGATEPSKMLGLSWDVDSDNLSFPINNGMSEENTKRHMLSMISQIFDPLGLLSPCIIRMKMLLQKLWVHKLSWDEQLPPEISQQWKDILLTMPELNGIRVPRHVICEGHNTLELHIFSDASERAYGSCAYIRSTNAIGEVFVHLLVAKSRVAPIKPTTIPRLELCAALMGARLYEKLLSSLRVQFNSTTCWSDSTIVLGWLKMIPSRLQPFVRNRTADILEKTNGCVWRHVPTDKNPADLISRGVNTKELQNLNLWWSGPSFLRQNMSHWPLTPNTTQTLPETRPTPEFALHVNAKEDGLINFERFSNFSRLKRAVAYVIRFIKKCRKVFTGPSYLTDTELNEALNLLVRITQQSSFPEYNLLISNQSLPKKSPLLKFNVFLDDNKIMRVGGRLVNSDFAYEKKHPIILQSNHRFSKLLFSFEHKRLLHAPPQLLLATIRDTYWPLGGRNLAKVTFHQCMLCTRLKGQALVPLMGNLPKPRLLPGGFPFSNVGVDYAGPLTAASRQGRGCKLVKVYVAIFICFATKAVHLELVGDLTSNNYLLALRRFMSRRGKPTNIYSDNGTSFVGAYNDLAKFLRNNCNSLAETAANEETKFHFIPAYTPHFGGLWEAGVKSTKFHLQRVLGNCNLTYEELNTTLVQIEALLNSRPITPLSSHPEDLAPLTPGHFLIGRPFTSLPVPDFTDSSFGHLTRFHRIEQLRQHFWTRWSKEYVAELQHRVKWQSNQHSLKLDALVVLKDDNLPPLKWRLGRIIAVHPGSNGISRVADVKTASGVVRRAFTRICPLPESDGSC